MKNNFFLKLGFSIILSLVITTILTMACGPQTRVTPTFGPSPTPTNTPIPTPTPVVSSDWQTIQTPIGPVYRFYDGEAGIVCYVIEKTTIQQDSNSGLDGGKGLGIGVGVGLAMSCIPVEETWLSKE